MFEFAVITAMPERPPTMGLVTVPKPDRPTGPILKSPVVVNPSARAETVTVSVADAPATVIANVACMDPAAMVTDGGRMTFALFDVSVITAPPDGAAPVNRTVPLTVRGPATMPVGSKMSYTAYDLSVTTACRLLSPVVAVTVAEVADVIFPLRTITIPISVPAGIINV
jgi:hypothetical protein